MRTLAPPLTSPRQELPGVILGVGFAIEARLKQDLIDERLIADVHDLLNGRCLFQSNVGPAQKFLPTGEIVLEGSSFGKMDHLSLLLLEVIPGVMN